LGSINYSGSITSSATIATRNAVVTVGNPLIIFASVNVTGGPDFADDQIYADVYVGDGYYGSIGSHIKNGGQTTNLKWSGAVVLNSPPIGTYPVTLRLFYQPIVNHVLRTVTVTSANLTVMEPRNPPGVD
jgi:hypothetical protein